MVGRGVAVRGFAVGQRPDLGDRSHGRVGKDAKGGRRDREDGRREARGCPHDRVSTEVGIHDHADRPGMADRRNPADREAGEVVRFTSGRPANIRFARHGGEPSEVDPVVTGDQAKERIRVITRRDHEDQRFDDLPELGTNCAGRLGSGVRRLVKAGHFERDALAQGRVEHALDRGVGGLVGHGRSLASGPRAAAPRGRSIRIMDVLILADGDAPDRAALDLAWPGWNADVNLVIAADGGARHAAGLGVAIDAWVGDGDSLDAEGMVALRVAGVSIQRADPHKDESDTELAVREALARGAAGLVIVGALGGHRIDHALANIGLLTMPELADRHAVLLDARTRITLIHAPGPNASPVRRSLAGRTGDLVSLLPLGADVAGVTTRGLAYPLTNEVLVAGPARGLSNVRDAPDAMVTVASGLLLVVESPATLSS